MPSDVNRHLIIAGVHKGATTSLYEYLIQHTKICPGKTKEIHYYTPLRYGLNCMEKQFYELQFEKCNSSKYLLDASPSYLYGKEKISQNIKLDFPDAKIIIILREPSARFISFFKFLKTEFRLDENIKLIDFIEKSYSLKSEKDKDELYHRAYREGEYVDYLLAWIETFGDELKIVFFDDIKDNPNTVLTDLCEWLDIEDDIYEKMNFDVKNKTRGSKYKAFYKFASIINGQFENYFRNHPVVKIWLNKIYFTVNATTAEESIALEDIVHLKEKYAEKNLELSKLLISNGYTDLPDWLRKVDNVT